LGLETLVAEDLRQFRGIEALQLADCLLEVGLCSAFRKVLSSGYDGDVAVQVSGHEFGLDFHLGAGALGLSLLNVLLLYFG